MNNERGRESRLEHAIDRAVQEMMHVDPRPGLRGRVLHRLNDPPARRSWIGAGAFAAAALVLMVALVSIFDRTSELPPASPGQAAAQPSAPSGEIPIAPGAQAADAAATNTPPPAAAGTAKVLEPKPESIFGPRTNQVRGASAPVPRGAEARGGTAVAPQQDANPPAEARKGESLSAGAQTANVKLDVTIVDQREGIQVTPKTVSVVTADRHWGRTRSKDGDAVLIVEAQPHIQPDGRIRVSLTLEYRPSPAGSETQPIPMVNKTVTAMLEDGKLMTVSQTADPTSNRTVKVDVRATLVK